jgi:hypothetical protein
MISRAGYIDALVLQPRSRPAVDKIALLAYLTTRAAHATDDDLRLMLVSLADEVASGRFDMGAS